MKHSTEEYSKKRIKDNRAYYDEFSDWYERDRAAGYHAVLNRLELEMIEPYAAGKKVLEVGCGTGQILSLLGQRCQTLAGMDLSRKMLEKAKSRGFQVVQSDITAMPYQDNCFDLLYSVKVLAHIENLQKAYEAMDRLVKKEGYLLLEFYNASSLRGFRWNMKKGFAAGKISESTRESDVFTQYLKPKEILKTFLPHWEVLEVGGIMTWTPHSAVYKIPILGKGMEFLERWSLRSPFRWFGGFLLFVIKTNKAN